MYAPLFRQIRIDSVCYFSKIDDFLVTAKADDLGTGLLIADLRLAEPESKDRQSGVGIEVRSK